MQNYVKIIKQKYSSLIEQKVSLFFVTVPGLSTVCDGFYGNDITDTVLSDWNAYKMWNEFWRLVQN